MSETGTTYRIEKTAQFWVREAMCLNVSKVKKTEAFHKMKNLKQKKIQ